MEVQDFLSVLLASSNVVELLHTAWFTLRGKFKMYGKIQVWTVIGCAIFAVVNFISMFTSSPITQVKSYSINTNTVTTNFRTISNSPPALQELVTTSTAI